jgi:lysophospholipase L1-like esterase
MLATMMPAATPAQLADATRRARLLAAADRARASNPRNAGPYAGALTISDRGATAPVETGASYPYSGPLPGVWRSNGGTPLLSSSAWRFYSAVIGATGGTIGQNNGRNANFWRIAVEMNARYLTLRLFPSALPYRLIVDGRYVSVAGTVLGVTSGTTLQHLLLDFGARAPRRVVLEGQYSQGFAGGFCEATGQLRRPDDDAPALAFLGDSYVFGSSASVMGDGVVPVMGDWMGARVHASGSGGTGWATPTNLRFDERIAAGDLALGEAAPDLICLMASINDRARDMAVVRANAATGLRAARVRYPAVPIVVFGCLPAATGGTTLACEQAVQAAVAQVADPQVAFVPVTGDATGAWVTGTGRIGAASGTGTSDWATVSDGIHPGDEGCAHIGRRYADAAVAALRAMG